MILYGLKACDTCRKALGALRAAGIDVSLRDIRDRPLTTAEREVMLAEFGDRLVNRASATWRSLSEQDRARPAADLLADHPALMKRPVIGGPGGKLWLGWDKSVQAIFPKSG